MCSITDSVNMILSTLGDSGRQRSLAFYSPWGSRFGHDIGTEQQQGSCNH